MICHVLDAVKQLPPERIILVVGEHDQPIREVLGEEVVYVRQDPPLGTGHAVAQVKPEDLTGGSGEVLVVYGDVPTITTESLRQLLAAHRRDRAAATILTARVPDPTGLGRIVRGPSGDFIRIVEEADASPADRTIDEVNSGLYCFQTDQLLTRVGELTRENAQGEYYLTDVLAILQRRGERVSLCLIDDPTVVRSINNRRELAEADQILRRRILVHLMDQGVTIVDPASTFVDYGVQVGKDTILHPFTFLEGATRLGEACGIGPSAHLIDTWVGDRSIVRHSVVEGTRLGDGVKVGPYAHLRPGTELSAGVRVGNFAEVKNSAIGEGSRVSHHCYVGDASVGQNVNIGAGAVVVNYDGRQKHRTQIGTGAFVGCNANLVAPVEVAAGSYVGAGSTITRDVPAGALGVARARQVNIEGWAIRRKELRGESR
jgi:bifunctional UDP-N-acetylglucosamine pyrophosphorylase/glucosamine-1-phosphate N-acetyltransferase